MTPLQFTKGFPEGFTPVYPIDQPQINTIGRMARQGVTNGLVSLRVGKSHGTHMPAVLNNEEGLKTALDEILEVRKLVEAGQYATEFMQRYWPAAYGPMPTHFPKPLAGTHRVFAIDEDLSFDNPRGCAAIVEMDRPGDLYRIVAPWMMSQGFVPKTADPHSFDFVDITSKDAVVAAQSRNAALERAFEIKFYRGVIRPEELYGSNMTAYDDGCPGHCESYAGHAAFSAATGFHFATNWFEYDRTTDKFTKLPPKVLLELFWACFSFAMWRSFAGVHYGVSNVEPFAPAHECGFRPELLAA